MRPAKPLDPLQEKQALAVLPESHAWVTASAGTGKTQVLSARVLRLLLAGTPPGAILCITFTKLAAAEMQERVMARLARWVRCDDDELASDLKAIGAGTDADTMALARRLFATVLDAERGLAVQTIHAFAQGLIASFPVEAGVAPGFAALDDRAGAMLRHQLLAHAVVAGDAGFLADLGYVALNGGEGRMADIAGAALAHAEALAKLRLEAVDPMLRRWLHLPAHGDAADALRLAVAGLPREDIARLARALGQADGVTALKMADNLGDWLKGDPADGFAMLARQFLKADGDPKLLKTLVPVAVDKANPWAKPLCEQLAGQIVGILTEQDAYTILAHAGAHLRVAVQLAQDWAAAKAAQGQVDFADMIRAARDLLSAPGAAEWVRYKLDARIDHVLVDEAQDTNLDQWQVVEGLTQEFFAGKGSSNLFRSLFVVGDQKQSIFGFQGADPRIFQDRKEHFAGLAQPDANSWFEPRLATNFRSTAAVLQVVDRVIDNIGAKVFDKDGVAPHVAHRPGGGEVRLWPPVLTEADADDEADDDEAPQAEIIMAHRIAETIAGWLDPATPLLLPSDGRPAQPQDILVLVRKRSRLSGALVAACHEYGVPVAGVDRLKLAEPLAVADLLALLHVIAQPDDDLALAGLLVSPFCGLDHDQLGQLAIGRRGSLWAALLASELSFVAPARDWLLAATRLAARLTPFQFLEELLSGPLQGRRKLLSRLGEEARDAIDALLDQALAAEAGGAASIQALLAWVGDDGLEIKRDPEAPSAAVRLMTVHGAKGLQAPIVILADACGTAPKPGNPLPVA
ncbi:MAG: UvrD-helicase domain-containing protein, partial [Sphingomonadales bacterium]